MRSSLLFLAVIALASTGCAARPPGGPGGPGQPDEFAALMKSWEGHTIDDLFRTWGPPNYLYPDGRGGQVAVYVPIPSSGASRSGAAAERLRAAARLLVYEPGMTAGWPIFRIFFTDTTGHVVHTEWRGRWECCSN